MNFFEEQIHQLGIILNTSLKAEKGTLCKLRIHGSFTVQIEHEPSKDRILFASFLCELPSGKFREEVLKEALKSNGSLDSFGTLAYSLKNNNLAFFLYSPGNPTAQELADTLTQFITKAEQWKTAVDSGQLHQIQGPDISLPSPF